MHCIVPWLCCGLPTYHGFPAATIICGHKATYGSFAGKKKLWKFLCCSPRLVSEKQGMMLADCLLQRAVQNFAPPTIICNSFTPASLSYRASGFLPLLFILLDEFFLFCLVAKFLFISFRILRGSFMLGSAVPPARQAPAPSLSPAGLSLTSHL